MTELTLVRRYQSIRDNCMTVTEYAAARERHNQRHRTILTGGRLYNCTFWSANLPGHMIVQEADVWAQKEHGTDCTSMVHTLDGASVAFFKQDDDGNLAKCRFSPWTWEDES